MELLMNCLAIGIKLDTLHRSDAATVNAQRADIVHFAASRYADDFIAVVQLRTCTSCWTCLTSTAAALRITWGFLSGHQVQRFDHQCCMHCVTFCVEC